MNRAKSQTDMGEPQECGLAQSSHHHRKPRGQRRMKRVASARRSGKEDNALELFQKLANDKKELLNDDNANRDDVDDDISEVSDGLYVAHSPKKTTTTTRSASSSSPYSSLSSSLKTTGVNNFKLPQRSKTADAVLKLSDPTSKDNTGGTSTRKARRPCSKSPKRSNNRSPTRSHNAIDVDTDPTENVSSSSLSSPSSPSKQSSKTAEGIFKLCKGDRTSSTSSHSEAFNTDTKTEVSVLDKRLGLETRGFEENLEEWKLEDEEDEPDFSEEEEDAEEDEEDYQDDVGEEFSNPDLEKVSEEFHRKKEKKTSDRPRHKSSSRSQRSKSDTILSTDQSPTRSQNPRSKRRILRRAHSSEERKQSLDGASSHSTTRTPRHHPNRKQRPTRRDPKQQQSLSESQHRGRRNRHNNISPQRTEKVDLQNIYSKKKELDLDDNNDKELEGDDDTTPQTSESTILSPEDDDDGDDGSKHEEETCDNNHNNLNKLGDAGKKFLGSLASTVKTVSNIVQHPGHQQLQ